MRFAGEALRSALDAAGVSQALVAYRTGLSTKHVNRLAQDKVVLTVDVAARIEAEFPAVSAEALLVAQVRNQLATSRSRPSGQG